MLFKLIAVHFLMDYPLQNDFLAKFKCRSVKGPIPWWHLMTAHSFIQGLGVTLVTGSVLCGVIETVLHFGIDVMKCEGKTDINLDQALHILCKIIYWWALTH